MTFWLFETYAEVDVDVVPNKSIPDTDPNTESDIEINERQVELAIQHIVKNGVKKHRIKPHPRHKMAKPESKSRTELAQAIVEAANKHAIPEMLLVAIAFRENSFIGDKKGKIGEESTFQIVPRVARFIRLGKFPWTEYSEPGCDLKTVDGSALCAAALMRIHMLRCKTLEKSLVLYASGHTCKADTPRLHWLSRDRLNLMTYLEGLSDE